MALALARAGSSRHANSRARIDLLQKAHASYQAAASSLLHLPDPCVSSSSSSAAAAETLKTHIAAFGSLLAAHVASVNDLLLETANGGGALRRTRSAGKEEEAGTGSAGRELRLLKGPRERFRPERYELLCERALGEL